MIAVLQESAIVHAALSRLLNKLGSHGTCIEDHGADMARIQCACRTAMAVLEEELDLAGASESVGDLQRHVEKLKNQVKYQRKTRRRLAETLHMETGERVGNRIHKMWLVRAGLSPPNVAV